MTNVAREKRHTDNVSRGQSYRLLLRQPFLLATIILIFVSLIIFILLPIFNVIKVGFTKDGAFSLENARVILSTRSYRQTFYNSLSLGAAVAVLATLTGYLFAFAITRTNMKGKRFFKLMATLPIISPPFILSLSIIFLFGKQGLVTKHLLGISNSYVYGMHSLMLVQVLSFFPVAYLTLSGILSSIDGSVEDAARSMGASRWKVFRTVTLPLSLPGIISALLLVFIQSLEDFSNPAVIGGDFSTLSVEAYRIITGMFDMNQGAMMAVLLLLPTICAYMLNKYWVSKKSFVTVTGKPTQERRLIDEKHITRPLFALCALVSGMIILFYGTVLMGAFVKTWGRNYALTLRHFENAINYGMSALQNSVKLAAWSAPVSGLIGMAIAYLTVRVRFPFKKAMEVSSVLAFAIPGTVLGIGYILSFNTRPLMLTGTAFIIVAVFIFRNMPVAIESGTSTLLQIDTAIEEASTILGAGKGHTFTHISLPLLRNAFFSGLVFSFVRGMTAVSAVIFVVSPRWNLATSKIFSLFESAKYSDAAAYVVIMIAIILLAILIISAAVKLLLAPRARVPRHIAASAAPSQQRRQENV